MDRSTSSELRRRAMEWLDRRPNPQVDYSWLTGFEFEGERVPLMDRQRGIRKPMGMDEALSIRTVYTDPRAVPPYEDSVGTDGLQRYKYRGSDPDHPENRALRLAFERKVPIVWFVGVGKALYDPIYPVWIIGDDPQALEFTLALDAGQRLARSGGQMDADTREYLARVTRVRLHQRVFRNQVLVAYDRRCAVCNLGHVELLDAAHIIADGQPHGQPIVPNGLALCKIHHAAFDSKILGIRPDLTLHIRQDILDEVDGPMLRHGLQDMHNGRLMKVPTQRVARPDPERLGERYQMFVGV